MASTCLQNDCQKQPRQALQPEQASDVTRHHNRSGTVKGRGARRERRSRGGGAGKELFLCLGILYMCLCVSLLICSLCSSGHATATATHLSLSSAAPFGCYSCCSPPPAAPLHLVHHFPSCFCVHKSCGMTESHSVMQPQHLMPLPLQQLLSLPPLVFWPVQTNVLIRETHTHIHTHLGMHSRWCWLQLQIEFLT